MYSKQGFPSTILGGQKACFIFTLTWACNNSEAYETILSQKERWVQHMHDATQLLFKIKHLNSQVIQTKQRAKAKSIRQILDWKTIHEQQKTQSKQTTDKRAYPVQRAPALCGVWGRVSMASLTLACAMRGDRDSNPGPSGHRR